jgi:hypothetical protein
MSDDDSRASTRRKLTKAQKRRLRFEQRHAHDNKGSHLLGVIPKNNVLEGRNAHGQFAPTRASTKGGPVHRFVRVLPPDLLALILNSAERLARRYQTRAEYANHSDIFSTQLTLPPANSEHKAELEIELRIRALLFEWLVPFVAANWRDVLAETQRILANPRAHFRMALLKYERDAGTTRQPPHTDSTNVPTVLLGIEETWTTPVAPSEAERTALFRCHADGSPSRAVDRGGEYYGPGDLLCIRPGVTHFVEVPACIAQRQVLLVFLDPEPT